MEIKTTLEIWKRFCEQLDLDILKVGSKTRVDGWCRPYQEDNKDKEWVAVDDMIKKLQEVMDRIDNLSIEGYDSKGYSLVSYSTVQSIISSLIDELIFCN